MISFRYFAIAFLSTTAACDSSQQSFNASNLASSTAISSSVGTAPTGKLKTPSAESSAPWGASPFGPTSDKVHEASGAASFAQNDLGQNSQTEDSPVERSVTVVAYSNLVPVKTHDYAGNSNEFATNATLGRPAIGPRPGDTVVGR